MRFLALALRSNDEKPHPDEKQDDRQELAKTATGGRRLSKRKER
jgi:hypothetical protein